MKCSNPVALEFRLRCDVCGAWSRVFQDREAILQAPDVMAWTSFFDKDHPCDYPVYYACPSCPPERLWKLAAENRIKSEQVLAHRQPTPEASAR